MNAAESQADGRPRAIAADRDNRGTDPRTVRWAWVAGASEGLGLAFAEELARRGYGVVMLARRAAVLEASADAIRRSFDVPVIHQALDLATLDLADRLGALAEQAPPHIGVYNAAFVPTGGFLDRPLDDLTTVIDVNVRGSVIFAHLLGRRMRDAGCGALVFMSSLAGEQGSPGIATYSASKAFITRLAEGLWAELGEHGIDVLVCCAGAVATPGYQATATGNSPGLLPPQVVARQTLDRIGQGPRFVPGWTNRLGALLLGRLLPRRWAVRAMGRATAALG